MKEIITLQVGQCGNQIGWKFWDLLMKEHGTCMDDSQALQTFFEPISHKAKSDQNLPFIERFRARAIAVDLEEGVISQLSRSNIGSLFKSQLKLTDVSGAGNNWACGYAEYGPEYRDDIIELVRRSLEPCESPQAFLMMHSIGGGTGSGFGSFILEQLCDEFPELYRFNVPLLPSKTDDVVTSPYNALLSTARLVDYADAVIPIENDRLISVLNLVKKQAQGVPIDFIADSTILNPEGITKKRIHPLPAESVKESVSADMRRLLEQADSILKSTPSPNPSEVSGLSAKLVSGNLSNSSVKQRASGHSSSFGGVGTGRASKVEDVRMNRVPTTKKTMGTKPADSRVKGSAHSTQGKTTEFAGPVLKKSFDSDSPFTIKIDDSEPVVEPTKLSGTAFDQMNTLVAHMLSNMTSSMRFPGPLNVDINEITSTLVPFPRLHFLTASLTPLLGSKPFSSGQFVDTRTCEKIIHQGFSNSNVLVDADLKQSTHLACAVLLRGPFAVSDVTSMVMKQQGELNMIPWNKDGFKVGICLKAPSYTGASALCMSNNSSMRNVLSRGYERFVRLYNVRAHLHHYLDYLSVDEFQESAEIVRSVCLDYESVCTK